MFITSRFYLLHFAEEELRFREAKKLAKFAALVGNHISSVVLALSTMSIFFSTLRQFNLTSTLVIFFLFKIALDIFLKVQMILKLTWIKKHVRKTSKKKEKRE